MANIVITGGSRGIGAAIVRLLAADGHTIRFLYRERVDKATALEQTLQAQGHDVRGIQCDIRQSDTVRDTFAAILAEWQQVDVLINCAGVSINGLIQDVTEAQWEDLFASNVHGTFYCTKAVLPGMIHRKQGVIINFSSIWGGHAASCEVAYSATKGAIEAFTRSLAEELSYSGIRVNAMAPGCVKTDMVTSLGEDTLARLDEDIPMGRFATPEEIAKWVRFLISDDASYMTGQIVTVAGGFVI